MAVSMKTLLLRRGGLVAAVTAIAIVAALLTKNFLLMVIPAIPFPGVAPFEFFGGRFLTTHLPFTIGVFLCLWLLVPVAAELEMRFVVSRGVLAAATGALLVIIVKVVLLVIEFFTSSGTFGLGSEGLYFDASQLGLEIRAVLVDGLQFFLAALPVVLIFALFQWQWLKNHPAKHDVAGILDV